MTGLLSLSVSLSLCLSLSLPPSLPLSISLSLSPSLSNLNLLDSQIAQLASKSNSSVFKLFILSEFGAS